MQKSFLVVNFLILKSYKEAGIIRRGMGRTEVSIESLKYVAVKLK